MIDADMPWKTPPAGLANRSGKLALAWLPTFADSDADGSFVLLTTLGEAKDASVMCCFEVWESHVTGDGPECEMTGTVKWDGCLETHDWVPHICGPESVPAYTRMLDAVWALAHPLFGHTDYTAPAVEGLESLS